ncbi:hypothetical protein LguiB_021050 [Lonicera macranthoides]
MAVEDSNSPHGLRLLIQDYPFAVDGLEIWSAIKTWVGDYCSCYYTKLTKWFKKTTMSSPSWKKCGKRVMATKSTSPTVNFRQYPYGGYPPNSKKAYLKTITSQLQSVLGISLIEILSRHSSDEVFLGQKDAAEWTTDMEAIKAFGRFGKKLEEIE